MLHVTLVLEDTVLVAPERGDGWEVVCSDMFDGKQAMALWTTAQMGAVAALAIGLGEELDSASPTTAELYRIVKDCFKDSMTDKPWPEGIRPVP